MTEGAQGADKNSESFPDCFQAMMTPSNDNGPDQVAEATDFTTTEASGFVKLRIGPKDKPEGREPLSVPSYFEQCARKGGDHTALAVKRQGTWQKWSYTDYRADVRTVAKAFISLGLQERHTVAILGFNAPEWFMSQLAAIFAGGIATGVYPTSSADATEYILAHSRTNIAVVENEKYLERIAPLRSQLRHLKAIVQYTGTPSSPDVLSWSQVLQLGKEKSDSELEERLKRVCINECSHLVYTSGTTGLPKGVMLSHDNVIYCVQAMRDGYNLGEKKMTMISYLPLSHVAANVTDLYFSMTNLGTVYFAGPDALKGSLGDTLKEIRPCQFFAIPRVWEKMQEGIMEASKGGGHIQKTVATWAKKVGLEHSKKVLECGDESLSSLSYQMAHWLVFRRVKEALGLDRCSYIGSAAAPLSRQTLEFFASLDIRIFEIYGMSECCGPQLANFKQANKFGTIGRSLIGYETTVKKPFSGASGAGAEEEEKEGEICMRGRNVMMGYLGDAAQTSHAIDDSGWLHSGDIGAVDSDGFFVINGRLKEIIITAGGENVAPAPIEEAIKKELPCLSNAMLVGDRRKFIACLLTLKVDTDPDTLEPKDTLAPAALSWCKDVVNSNAKTVQDILDGDDNSVSLAIDAAIDRVNVRAPSNVHRIKKWKLLSRDFSLGGGELGPTLKLKRHHVLNKYQDVIDTMYE